MGNSCKCVCRQTDDEAEDALLDGFLESDGPRGPPPPYQPQAPIYTMTEQQHLQFVQRLTLIQCLPCGMYEAKKGSPEKKGEKEKDRECPICMMDFVIGEPIRLLPCMHYYHMRCIDDWLMRSLTCPTCMERVDIGMRNTALSSRALRRRLASSSSTTSTATSSSTEQLISQHTPSTSNTAPTSQSAPQVTHQAESSQPQRHRLRRHNRRLARSTEQLHVRLSSPERRPFSPGCGGYLTNRRLVSVTTPPQSPNVLVPHRQQSPPAFEYHFQPAPSQN